jgi:hypothetical protein
MSLDMVGWQTAYLACSRPPTRPGPDPRRPDLLSVTDPRESGIQERDASRRVRQRHAGGKSRSTKTAQSRKNCAAAGNLRCLVILATGISGACCRDCASAGRGRGWRSVGVRESYRMPSGTPVPNPCPSELSNETRA